MDQRRVQRGQGDRLDQHRHDPPLGRRGPGERRAQLRAAERGGEVGLGAHRQQPVRPLQRRGHAGHEVLTRRPVPHIQLDGVAGLLQLPGQPLRPPGVPTGVTDEEIGPPTAHAPALHPSPAVRETRRPDTAAVPSGAYTVASSAAQPRVPAQPAPARPGGRHDGRRVGPSARRCTRSAAATRVSARPPPKPSSDRWADVRTPAQRVISAAAQPQSLHRARPRHPRHDARRAGGHHLSRGGTAQVIANAILHRDYSIADDVHVRIFDNRIPGGEPWRPSG